MMLSQIVKKQAEMIAARKAAEAERERKPAARPSARAARTVREARAPEQKSKPEGEITLAVRVDAESAARMEALIGKDPKQSKKRLAREALRKFLDKHVSRKAGTLHTSILSVPRPAPEGSGVTIGIQVDADMHGDLLRWCELSGFTKRQALLAALHELLFPAL